MAKRHSDAIAIQLGACNPSGIAHSIVSACQEIRAETGFTGTAQITSDPAIRLMVHQLAFICGVIGGVEDFINHPNFTECTNQCDKNIKMVA